MPRHALRRPALVLAAALLALVPAVAVHAQDPAASPGPIIVSPDASAIPAIPDPTVTGALPTPWDHIVVGPDGRTLTVYFWNGAEGCYGLHSVDVSTDAGHPTVTVLTGMRADAASRLCIAIAQLYSTQVVLDAPILGGGMIEG